MSGSTEVKMISEWVKTQVSSKRFAHIQGVVKTSQKLASKYNLILKKAELASWLHDCAKELPRQTMLSWLHGTSFQLDTMEKKMPGLWHPHVGAAIALRKWKIKDNSILEAIRCHTLGKPGMGRLAQVVFVADFIEPGRTFIGVERVRKIALKGLADGVCVKTFMTIQHLFENKMTIHSRLVDTWNHFLKKDIV
jgi:predicted HD superfamily hydrolase involved in NAD metabolism